MAAREFPVDGPTVLLVFLFERLADMKRGEVKRLLRFGSVQVNGVRTTRYDFALVSGDVVSIDRERAARAPAMPGIRIVHEDAAVVVVEKPAGLLTVATATEHERTVHHELNAHYRGQGGRYGTRLFVVHRLDRDTSGLLLFARTEEARRLLQEDWYAVEKRYYAVVEGLMKRDEGRLESRLSEDAGLRMHSASQGKRAVTYYRVVRRAERRTLLDVLLETGRKNQIRVHLAEINHPVVGDLKYGTKVSGGRLGLHAYKVAFNHPTTGERMSFETALPTALERLLNQP